jgi:hypothetical protein
MGESTVCKGSVLADVKRLDIIGKCRGGPDEVRGFDAVPGNKRAHLCLSGDAVSGA